MDQLWAGWRRTFIEGNQISKNESQCVLCALGGLDPSAESHVIARAKFNYVVLNAYPYAPGHLMVVPYEHVARLNDLVDELLIETMLLLRTCTSVLEKVYEPGGFNLGSNIGRAGGAAIDDHIHFHVVPRWVGDTNFMTSVANMRVLPESLGSSFERIFGAWNQAFED